jgi:hypothetical protein
MNNEANIELNQWPTLLDHVTLLIPSKMMDELHDCKDRGKTRWSVRFNLI